MIFKKNTDELNNFGFNDYADYIVTLENKLIEMEKNRRKLKKINKSLIKLIPNIDKSESIVIDAFNLSDLNLKNKRDLQQRAKGVTDYVSSLDGNCEVKIYKSWVKKDGLIYAEQLRKEARGIK